MRARIYRHPIHPMLVVFPIGLWVFSFVCDLIFLFGNQTLIWRELAFYTMAGGVIGALLAAIPGFMDYLAIPAGRIRQIAVAHMTLNLIVTGLFMFNLGLRINTPAGNEAAGVLISAIAIILLAVSGWLGGSMVYVHGVGVQTAASPAARERGDRAA